MVSPKELVECVSDVLRAPLATVTVHDRNLAVAGLRTVNGRGRAVAAVTADDAANLLIAVMASEQVRDSAKAVHEFGSLISRGGKLLEEVSSALARRHTFRDGLSSLISLIADGAFIHSGDLTIDMKIEIREPAAQITLINDLGESNLSYAPMALPKSQKQGSDLYVTKGITQITLFTIAELIRDKVKSNAKPSVR